MNARVQYFLLALPTFVVVFVTSIAALALQALTWPVAETQAACADYLADLAARARTEARRAQFTRGRA